MRKILTLLPLLFLVGCFEFALGEYESTTGVDQSTSFSVLPISLGLPGDSAVKEMAALTAKRDVLLERLRLQDRSREDVEAQIVVVDAQIDAIPKFTAQQDRLTLALTQSRVTSTEGQKAFDLAVIGKVAMDDMIAAQQSRNDGKEAEERAILVAITAKMKAELDRLGV